MQDLPDPVIFTRDGQILFYNEATLKMLDIETAFKKDVSNILLGELSWLKQRKTKKLLSDIISRNEKDTLKMESRFTGYKNGKKKWISVKYIEPVAAAHAVALVMHQECVCDSV